MDDLVTNRIAIIPARGGSKRLPGKNVMDFYGKPMIAWTIEAALKTDLFDVVLVSTDSEQIADISKAYGAQVPFLRKEHADDYSTVSEATLSALIQMELHSGKSYETVVQLMANCPMRSAVSINSQVLQYERMTEMSLLSGFRYGMFNPWWAHYRDGERKVRRLHNEGDNKTRSQDLPELYCPSGATWITSANLLKTHRSFYTPNYDFFELTWQEAVDIDDLDDLNLAKAAFLLYNESF